MKCFADTKMLHHGYGEYLLRNFVSSMTTWFDIGSADALISVVIGMMMFNLTQGLRVTESLCVDPGTTDQGTPYDPTGQVCCAGAVYDVLDIAGQNCCGRQVYDNLSHTCCGQEAIPIDNRKQCCGGSIVFDSETQMCCGNNVYAKTDDFNVCCGNYPMNVLQDTCCHMIGLSGMTVMPTRDKGQCCGLHLTYDPEVQMCCQSEREDGMYSEVVPRSDNMACCGSRAYNTLHQVCCGGVVSNITLGRTECCGSTAYNPDIEHCCAATIFPIGTYGHGQCCGDRAYHPSSASCCQGILNDGIPEAAGVQACCRQLAYLETESVCCGGQLHPKSPGLECCGKDTYNSDTHICCAGNIHLKSSPNDECCGGVSYNPSTETCCPGNRIGSEGLTFPIVGGRCCRDEDGGMLGYDPSKGTCCIGRRNEVFYPDTPAATSTCCGHYLLMDTHLCDTMAEHPVRKTAPSDNQVCINRNWRRSRTYNSRTQVCIRGRVRSKNQVSHINGCGPHILDPATEICCMGRIHPNKDKQGNPAYCCNRSIHSYIPEHQSCCSGRVDDIPAHTSKCCRNRAYNTATHTCDRNGMIRLTSEMALFPLMCGIQPYHPSEHECCGEVLIGPGQTCCREIVYETGATVLGEGRCCNGVTGYDPERDICCGGVVHENAEQGEVCCGSEIWSPHENFNSVCCDGRLQSSLGGFRRNCSGRTAYNSMTETVCDGVVHPQPNGGCCGKLVYDSSSEVCCEGNVFPKETPHTTCCGAMPYDSGDSGQRCCDGSLHRDVGDLSCCGNQLFDPDNQHCCFGSEQNAMFILRASGGRTCSSLHSTSSSMYAVCNGKMHVALASGACCGEEYIPDTQTQMCCNGSVVQKLFGTNSVCCNGAVIDSSKANC